METFPSYQMGLLHQIVLGVVGTSHRGDPPCWWVQYHQRNGTKKRAKQEIVPIEFGFNLLLKNGSSLHHNLEMYFYKVRMYHPRGSYPWTVQVKVLSGEGEPSFHAHVRQVINFFLHQNIEYEDVWNVLFSLTFTGHAKRWCYTLPFSSIDSFG